MTDKPQINHEAAFLAAAGVNPAMVKAGTVNIEFQGQVPVITFTLMVPTDWEGLAKAIDAGKTGKMPEPPKAPADRRPPTKRTPRKKA